MTAAPNHHSMFDSFEGKPLLEGLLEVTTVRLICPSTVAETTASHGQVESHQTLEDGPVARSTSEPPFTLGEVSERMFCSACQCSFESREEQMEHYKLDWHRFNLKQKLVGRPPATAEEFERRTGAGDMSSISGSDSETEEGGSESDRGILDKEDRTTVDTEAPRLANRVVFLNASGQYLSVYRCALLSKKMDSGTDLADSLLGVGPKSVWVILMTGGGHFAGAVFQGKEVLQHKTFHRYTVRAKRGTAQGLRDSQNRSHAPKSAGAALRRYNEAALVKEVQDLLESWSEHLGVARSIFLRAPSYNRTIFFGGRAPPLDRKDPRIHTLPFATRRATFREIRKVHEALSTIHVYGSNTDVSSLLSPPKKVWKKKAAKPVPLINPNPEITAPPVVEERESSEEGSPEVELVTVEVTLGTLELREHETYPRRRRRRGKRKEGCRPHGGAGDAEDQDEELGTSSPRRADGDERRTKDSGKGGSGRAKREYHVEDDGSEDSWEYGLRDALYTACKTGDLVTLRSLLSLPGEEGCPGSDRVGTPVGPQALTPSALLNREIDPSGFTLLHVASAAGQRGVVTLLMDAGSDPAYRDKKGRTPYAVAAEKNVRLAFRKYMAQNPAKYDYSKAQVPGPLTADIELKKAEKKRAQKVAKKQREKEQQEERKREEAELEEKRRFAALTDREKRALAAEKRLAEQIAVTKGSEFTNVRRCWQCGDSLSGRVPFQYLDFSFCTPHCVQEHRRARASDTRP